MAETYSAGTLTAELDLDSSKLETGIDNVSDSLSSLESRFQETVSTLTDGMQKGGDATEGFTEATGGASEAVEGLIKVVEALGLLEAFNVLREKAMECVEEFDNDSRALRAMTAAVGEVDAEPFEQLAEQMASVSRNSVATEENAIALASRFGLTNQAIAELLPQVNQFAEITGKSLPEAMQAMAIAIDSGTASPRRLGLALDDAQKSAFEAGDQMTRVGILVDAMGEKTGSAGDKVHTAGMALAQLKNTIGEAMAAIGSLIDKPLAAFFDKTTAAVQALVNGIRMLKGESITAPGSGEEHVFAGNGAAGTMDFSKGFAIPGFEGTGVTSGLEKALAPRTATQTLDFGSNKDAFGNLSDSLGQKDLLDFSKGLRDATAGFDPLAQAGDNVSTAFTGLDENLRSTKDIDKSIDDLVSSFDKAADAANHLALEDARRADRDATRQATQRNAPGGAYTALLAGVNDNMTGAQQAAALANTTTGQQVGGALLNITAGQAGVAGQVATGAVSGAMGNPAGFAQAAMAIVSQSAGFQKIMEQLNQVISGAVAAIEPVIEVLNDAQTPVLNAIDSALSLVGKILTSLQPVLEVALSPLQLLGETIGAIIDVISDVVGPMLDALSAAFHWVAEIAVDTFINPLIEVWDWIIDAIDDALGWADVDLSSLKINTVNLDNNSAAQQHAASATQATADAMNSLIKSSVNIPQGFKTALAVYNASASSGNPAATLGGIATGLQNSGAAIGGSLGTVMSSLGTGFANLFAGTANKNSAASTVTIQQVTVQATTADLLGQIQNSLKNMGYLKSGTNSMGATNRTQYG